MVARGLPEERLWKQGRMKLWTEWSRGSSMCTAPSLHRHWRAFLRILRICNTSSNGYLVFCTWMSCNILTWASIIGHSGDCFFCTFRKELPRVVNIGELGTRVWRPGTSSLLGTKIHSCASWLLQEKLPLVCSPGLLGFVICVSISKAALPTFYFSMKYFGGGSTFVILPSLEEKWRGYGSTGELSMSKEELQVGNKKCILKSPGVNTELSEYN